VDRQGTDCENLPRFLYHDRAEVIGNDQVCMFGHVQPYLRVIREGVPMPSTFSTGFILSPR
jgi:hypothetical protein